MRDSLREFSSKRMETPTSVTVTNLRKGNSKSNK